MSHPCTDEEYRLINENARLKDEIALLKLDIADVERKMDASHERADEAERERDGLLMACEIARDALRKLGYAACDKNRGGLAIDVVNAAIAKARGAKP